MAEPAVVRCETCDLLRRHGHGDRICKACADRHLATARRVREALNKAADEDIARFLAGPFLSTGRYGHD